MSKEKTEETDSEAPRVVVVGSVGIDTIETTDDKQVDILGGSVSYACAAASFFAPTGMVGVVGTDFPDSAMELFAKLSIDTRGLQRVDGRTFRWSGRYDEDMINRTTLSTELNVFADFSPALPDAYRGSPYVLLGNISPDLQLHVLSQVTDPRFVVADTMDLWINTARDDLIEVVSKVNMLMLNDSEARQLTDEFNLVRAARRILSWGPDYVVVKKGEHGALLFSARGVGIVPAYPLDAFKDPTGAGDAFAGGFVGAVARQGGTDDASMRSALLYGSTVASFGVEQFSLERLAVLNMDDIEARYQELRRMVAME